MDTNPESLVLEWYSDRLQFVVSATLKYPAMF